MVNKWLLQEKSFAYLRYTLVCVQSLFYAFPFFFFNMFTRIFYACTHLSSYSCAKARATADGNRAIQAPSLWFSTKPSYGVLSFCCKQVQLLPVQKVCLILVGDQNCPCCWQTLVFAAQPAWITQCVTKLSQPVGRSLLLKCLG